MTFGGSVLLNHPTDYFRPDLLSAAHHRSQTRTLVVKLPNNWITPRKPDLARSDRGRNILVELVRPSVLTFRKLGARAQYVRVDPPPTLLEQQLKPKNVGERTDVWHSPTGILEAKYRGG
jgi:hypothetical protein